MKEGLDLNPRIDGFCDSCLVAKLVLYSGALILESRGIPLNVNVNRAAESLLGFKRSMSKKRARGQEVRLVRRVVVILILPVSLKPDSAFVSGPCMRMRTLIDHEGT